MCFEPAEEFESGGKPKSILEFAKKRLKGAKASGAENGFFRKWAGYKANVSNNEVRMTNTTAFSGIIPSRKY